MKKPFLILAGAITALGVLGAQPAMAREAGESPRHEDRGIEHHEAHAAEHQTGGHEAAEHKVAGHESAEHQAGRREDRHNEPRDDRGAGH